MLPHFRSKNVYEAVMLKNRVAEQKKEAMRQEHERFYNSNTIRAKREQMWTSDSSFNNRCMRVRVFTGFFISLCKTSSFVTLIINADVAYRSNYLMLIVGTFMYCYDI